MQKTCMQFHATVNELYIVISEMLDKGYSVMGFILSREFKLISVNKQTGIDEFRSLFGVIVSKKEIEKDNSYADFLEKRNDFLGMYIGEETDSYLLESTIWAASKDSIDPDWRRFINRFKRKMLRGAWIINPETNSRGYYKNHMYSAGAKERYDSGVVIRQFEQSPSYYALVKEDELSSQMTGFKLREDCVLEKIDDSHYKYSRSAAHVSIIRNEDGSWYYTRLEDISRSEDFDTFLKCLDVAYHDMMSSEL